MGNVMYWQLVHPHMTTRVSMIYEQKHTIEDWKEYVTLWLMQTLEDVHILCPHVAAGTWNWYKMEP